jgi:hypothetical protein
MDSVIINGIRYVPFPAEQQSWWVILPRSGDSASGAACSVYNTKQANMEHLPDLLQLRITRDPNGAWAVVPESL